MKPLTDMTVKELLEKYGSERLLPHKTNLTYDKLEQLILSLFAKQEKKIAQLEECIESMGKLLYGG